MSSERSPYIEADGLTIREVHIQILHAPLAEQIGISFGGLSQCSMALVEVKPECGLRGYGESWINYPPWVEHERIATVCEGVTPLLVGQDATQINKLHALMVRELEPYGHPVEGSRTHNAGHQWRRLGPMGPHKACGGSRMIGFGSCIACGTA